MAKNALLAVECEAGTRTELKPWKFFYLKASRQHVPLNIMTLDIFQDWL